jgi:glycosyltransferase involved in cell wall biosynthesis
LFNPLDENELVAKIDAYFDLNLEERQKIGAAGRLTVQNGFTEAEYVLNLEKLYTSWN